MRPICFGVGSSRESVDRWPYIINTSIELAHM